MRTTNQKSLKKRDIVAPDDKDYPTPPVPRQSRRGGLPGRIHRFLL
jgi:hypothetical protein